MNNSNKEQLNTNSSLIKSIEVVQPTKSGHLGKPLHPAAPAARRMGWRFAGLIALVVFCVIPVIGFLLQSESVARFEGLGVAFCAIAFGWFLIRHLVRVMVEEEDLQEELEDEQIEAEQSTVSPPEQDSTGLPPPPHP